MGKGFCPNLSDLLLLCEEKIIQNLLYKMNSMIQTINNLDYIPPVQMPADIRTTGSTGLGTAVSDARILDSSYEVIVLDIGCGIDENFQLLDMCKKIYMPVLSDAVSQCKIAMNIKYRLLCKRLIEERKRVGVIQYYNVLFIMELVSDKDIWSF